MSVRTFLTVELTGLDTPLARFTHDHPGVRLDILNSSQPKPGTSLFRSQLVATGLNASTVRDLNALLREHQPAVQEIERDERSGIWVGSYDSGPAQIRDPRAIAFVQWSSRAGLLSRWITMTGGIVNVRTLLPPGADADALLAACVAELRRVGVAAKAAIDRTDSPGVDILIRSQATGR